MDGLRIGLPNLAGALVSKAALGATVNRTSTTTGQPAVSMSNNSTLSGMTINVTGANAATGVSGSSVSNIPISNNTIFATATSNNVSAIGLVNSTATISGNNLSAISASGQYASGLFINNGTYTIVGNTFNASGGNISRNLNIQNNVTFNPGSTGNTLASGACMHIGCDHRHDQLYQRPGLPIAGMRRREPCPSAF